MTNLSKLFARLSFLRWLITHTHTDKLSIIWYSLTWEDVLKIPINPDFTVMKWVALMNFFITSYTKESVHATFPTSQQSLMCLALAAWYCGRRWRKRTHYTFKNGGPDTFPVFIQIRHPFLPLGSLFIWPTTFWHCSMMASRSRYFKCKSHSSACNRRVFCSLESYFQASNTIIVICSEFNTFLSRVETFVWCDFVHFICWRSHWHWYWLH